MPRVTKAKTIEEINFLASAKFQSFTYQADKTYKAGEIYPANDATAIGIVLSDVAVDVNNGEDGQPVAIVVEGYVIKERLTEEPTDAAVAALKGIKFHPVVPSDAEAPSEG